MALQPGEFFAGYRVIRLIGSGGMGEVYLAKHPRLRRDDALKILRSDISSDSTFQQRFTREADSIARLQHPNIVMVFDRGTNEGQMWIACQFIGGTDAHQLVRKRYPAGMPIDETIEIVSAVANALDYAHESGLIHRDVKPANLLLSDPDRSGRRRTYLADFGIARPIDDFVQITETNHAIGTVAYAAPEQLKGEALDGRADQYALAATAFHLVTGTPLFPNSNSAAVISAHHCRRVPVPSSIRPQVSYLDAVFTKALSMSPANRYRTCRDFAEALTEAARNSGVLHPANADTIEGPVPPQWNLEPVSPPPPKVSPPPPKVRRPSGTSQASISPPGSPSRGPKVGLTQSPPNRTQSPPNRKPAIRPAPPVVKKQQPEAPPPPPPPPQRRERKTRLAKTDIARFVAELKSALRSEQDSVVVSAYWEVLTKTLADFSRNYAIAAAAAAADPESLIDDSYDQIDKIADKYASDYRSDRVKELLSSWRTRAYFKPTIE